MGQPSAVTTPEGRSPLIRARDLDVRFDGARKVHAVRGISFDVFAGEAVAIVGESGSGKSVTSRSLVGLAGEGAVVTASELTVAGRDARRLSERAWRTIRGNRIGLVFQDALTSLDPLKTVGQEITETLREHRVVPRRGRRARVEELLASVGIPDPAVRAAQYPHQLSGGLRQRALIASALAGEPDLIIADEPTTALDVTVQTQILDLLEARCALGTALLLVSHDLAVVSRIADRVLVMTDGVVVEEGPTAQVLSRPEHPYTRRLLEAIPSAKTRGTRLQAAADVRAVPATTAAVGAAPDQTHASAEPGAAPGWALEVDGVSKSFELPGGGRRTAVQDVTLQVAFGEKLGVVGESGSGKSTLARLLLGLTSPDEGEIRALGRPWTARAGLTRAGAQRQRDAIQLISQDPLGSCDPRYDVARVIGEPLRGRLGRPEIDRRVSSLLDMVGLPQAVARASVRRLSGGQRQRVSIARAIALQPRVLVCDEPVSALDVSVQAQVLDLLASLTSEIGTALVFISHDLGVVHHLVDDVVVMRHGRVLESGDVGEVFHDPLHPYSQALVAAIPTLPELRPEPEPTAAGR